MCDFWSVLLADIADSTTNARLVQARFSPRHILQRRRGRLA
jgi:hypothetical protein